MAIRSRRTRRLLILMTVVLAVGALGVAAVAFRQAQRARLLEEARQAGLEAYEAGEYEAALDDLGYVLGRDQSDPDVLLAYVESRRRVPLENGKHLVRAVSVARMASEANPDDPRPLEELLELYGRMGRMTERLETADRLLEIDPAHRDAMWAKVQSLWPLGRREEALQTLRTMLQSHPRDARAQSMTLDLMNAMDRPHEEIREFTKELIERAPDDVNAAVTRARALAMTEDVDAAREAAKRAAELEQRDPDSLMRTVRVLDALGLADQADALLQREVGADERGRLAAAVGAERAWKDGRLDDARSHVQAAKPVEEAPDRLLGWAALIGEEDGSLAEAARAELESRSSDQARFWTALLQGRDAIEARQWAEARRQLRSAQGSERANGLATFLLGRVDQRTGERESAIERWEALAGRHPRWYELRLSLVSLLMENGRFVDAHDQARSVFGIWPERMTSAVTLARALTALVESGEATGEQSRQAISLLEEIRNQAPDNSVAPAMLARVRASRGETDEAQRIVQRLASDGPLPPKSELLALLNVMEREGLEGIDALLDAAMEQRPDDPDLLLAAAERSRRSGSPQAGERLLREAIERLPAESQRRAQLERALGVYLDRAGAQGALARLKASAQARRDDSQAQLALLESSAAWSDEQAVKGAIAALKRAAGESGTLWRIFEARRLLEFESGEASAAKVVQLLTPVIRRQPDNARALAIQARAMMQLDDRAGAIDALSRALDAEPQRIDLYPALIELLQRAGRTSDAERRLHEFVQRGGVSDELRRRRASLLMRQGMYSQAASDWRVLAKSGRIEDRLNLARVEARLGRTDQARRIYDQLLTREDRTLEAVVAAADFFARDAGVEKGLQTLDRLPDSASEPERLRVRAAFFERHGRIEQAVRTYATLTESGGGAEDWAKLAALRLRAGEVDAAGEAVDAGLQIEPEHARLLALRQFVRLARGEAVPEDALASVAETLQREGAQGEATSRLVEAIRTLQANPDQPDQAIEQLRSVTREHPTYFPAWRALVTALRAAERGDEAADAARAAAQAAPTNADAAALAARSLAAQGRFGEALVMAREHRNRSEGDPIDAIDLIARLQISLDQRSAALSELDAHAQRLAARANDRPALLTLYAGLLIRDGRADEAAEMLDPLAENDPAWARRRVEAAGRAMDRPQRARAWLERTTTAALRTPLGRLAAGQQWYNLALREDDDETYERVVEILSPLGEDEEHGGQAALLLAAANERLGDLDKAKQYYRRTIEEFPEAADALNNLAYLLVKTDDSMEEALRLAERAVELNSENTSFQDTLGAALLRLGRHEQAEQVFAEAVQESPNNPALLLGLAEARAALGRTSEAAAALRRFEALGVDESSLDEELRRRLERARAAREEAEQDELAETGA